MSGIGSRFSKTSSRTVSMRSMIFPSGEGSGESPRLFIAAWIASFSYGEYSVVFETGFVGPALSAGALGAGFVCARDVRATTSEEQAATATSNAWSLRTGGILQDASPGPATIRGVSGRR